MYGYISGFDDKFELYDPTDPSSTDIIELPKQCADTIPLIFGFNSCSDSITVISAALLQGQGVLLDENQQDTILRVVPEEGFSGDVIVAITVRDGSGDQESIEFRFDIWARTTTLLQCLTLSHPTTTKSTIGSPFEVTTTLTSLTSPFTADGELKCTKPIL